jgi:hypothetical protein
VDQLGITGHHPTKKGLFLAERPSHRDHVIATPEDRPGEPGGSFFVPAQGPLDAASGGSGSPPAVSPTQSPAHPDARSRKLRRRNWKSVFIETYRETGIVSGAAKAAGVHRTTVYAAAAQDPKFAAAWTAADEDFVDMLESELIRRALSYSDPLLEFTLKNRRPRVYGATYNVRAEIRAEVARVADKLSISFEEVLDAATRRAEELGR